MITLLYTKAETGVFVLKLESPDMGSLIVISIFLNLLKLYKISVSIDRISYLIPISHV
jgi:hypothetical protein